VLLFLGFVATGNFSSNKARQSAFCLNPEDSPVVGDGLAPNERVTSLYLSEAHVLRLTTYLEGIGGLRILAPVSNLSKKCPVVFVILVFADLFFCCDPQHDRDDWPQPVVLCINLLNAPTLTMVSIYMFEIVLLVIL